MDDDIIILECPPPSIITILPIVPPGICLMNGPRRGFKLDGKMFLLFYLGQLDESNLLVHLDCKWFYSKAKFWSRTILPDAGNPFGWTVVLVQFENRFRTRALYYFDYSGVHPLIYLIKPTPRSAWASARQFVIMKEEECENW